MRVLHCLGFHDSRLFYRSNYYLEGLARNHPCEVLMLTSDLTFPHIGQKKQRIRTADAGLPYGIIRKRAIFHLKDAVYFRVKKAIRDFKPDIAHIYEGRQFATYLAARECHRLGIPFIYEQEQRLDGSSAAGRLWSRVLVRRWLRWLAMHAAEIRVVTPGGLRYLNSICEVDLSAKTTITTLAFEESMFFRDDEKRSMFRKKAGVGNDEVCIGITGKFSRQKRIEACVKAFKEVRGLKARFFIQGIFEPGYEKDIREECAADPRIRVATGLLNRSDLNEFYNGIDYMVWTSPTNSYFEALGAETKIIIPRSDATSHLKSENIIFYGDGDCIEDGSGILLDGMAGKEALKAAFEKLAPYSKVDGRKSNFAASGIVKQLFGEYIRFSSRQS